MAFLQTSDNTSRMGTHFTVKFDARAGIETGTSAFDRCRTIQVLAYPSPVAEPNGRLIRQYLLDFEAGRDGRPSLDLIGLSRLYALEPRDGLVGRRTFGTASACRIISRSRSRQSSMFLAWSRKRCP